MSGPVSMYATAQVGRCAGQQESAEISRYYREIPVDGHRERAYVAPTLQQAVGHIAWGHIVLDKSGVF